MKHETAQSGDGVDVAFEQVPEHYIDSQTSLIEKPLRTLKYADAFAVLDSTGDIGIDPASPEGVFLRDTRYLSTFDFRFDGKRALLLGSVVEDDNGCLSADLTNPDIHRGDDIVMPRDIIAIERTKLLFEGCCYERIGFSNFDGRTRSFRVSIRFDADFRDLFEVRGARRPARGRVAARVVDAQSVELRYDGLDGVSRYTGVSFNPAPERLDVGFAEFTLTLEPGEKHSIFATVACGESAPVSPIHFLAAYRQSRRGLKEITRGIATVESSNALFNEVACRSTSDIYMLMSRTPYGLYPYAGIPWFSTVFGRDGIITAMMMLWIDPTIAKGVLQYLAATQAEDIDPAADAQPGKILHETRHGEMARLKEVPFALYYGTVDATPLFVMLAGMYFERTGDKATIDAIWPNIEAALNWCDVFGDRDGDGFVEYYRETESGLANQGWKDSQDSVFHADGSDALGPIALCEVQGYVYAAKCAAAVLATTRGDHDFAACLEDQAAELKTRFHEAYWCEEIGTYALALDGDKKPCRVRSSNAGHALFTGIADPACAARVADGLTSPEAFSGWGIRTLSQGQSRYNPMSYHNGSIWPHDNAMIVLGFARYGLKDHAAKVFGGMYDAVRYQELRRLPELFCGFGRRQRRGPTAYPVACAPQAWASAAPFAFLAACLGMQLRHDINEISFTDPRMPAFLDDVTIRGLRLGTSRADVRLRRDGADVTVTVLKREGNARIVQSK
jgi:glycogen debranching enzyme